MLRRAHWSCLLAVAAVVALAPAAQAQFSFDLATDWYGSQIEQAAHQDIYLRPDNAGTDWSEADGVRNEAGDVYGWQSSFYTNPGDSVSLWKINLQDLNLAYRPYEIVMGGGVEISTNPGWQANEDPSDMAVYEVAASAPDWDEDDNNFTPDPFSQNAADPSIGSGNFATWNSFFDNGNLGIQDRVNGMIEMAPLGGDPNLDDDGGTIDPRRYTISIPQRTFTNWMNDSSTNRGLLIDNQGNEGLATSERVWDNIPRRVMPHWMFDVAGPVFVPFGGSDTASVGSIVNQGGAGVGDFSGAIDKALIQSWLDDPANAKGLAVVTFNAQANVPLARNTEANEGDGLFRHLTFEIDDGNGGTQVIELESTAAAEVRYEDMAFNDGGDAGDTAEPNTPEIWDVNLNTNDETPEAVGGGNPNVPHAVLYQFDIPQNLVGATIADSSDVTLHLDSSWSEADVELQVHAVTSAWDAQTVTYGSLVEDNRVPGDIDWDMDVDDKDVDALLYNRGRVSEWFDLVGDDDTVTDADVAELVEVIAGTFFGDANGDGSVDVIDLGRLGLNFSQFNKRWAEGDFNGDGLVDVIDLGRLGLNFGSENTEGGWADEASGSPVVAVPEPTGLALLGLGGLALLRRRR